MHSRSIKRIRNCLLLVTFFHLSMAAQSAEGERYALLVGVSTYRSDSGFNNLKYPESDVIALKDALLELGFDEANIRLMVKSSPDERFNPRRENILKELKLLLANKGKDDTVTVVLSGHGLQPRAKDGAFFCPSDAMVKDSETWLDLETVFEQLKNCGAGGKLLIADCCRDDPALANIKGLPQDVQSVTRPGKLKPPQNVAALFSCGNGEVAFEEEELKGGVFAHFLVQGLKGQAAFNGEIEIKSLAGYLQKKVYDYVSAKRGASQVPSFKMESDRPLVLAKIEPDELTLDVSGNAESRLLAHEWRGNVRELRSVIRNAALICRGKEIQNEDLGLPAAGVRSIALSSMVITLADVEREHISKIMRQVKGNITQAAELLGIARSTLVLKLKEYGIR